MSDGYANPVFEHEYEQEVTCAFCNNDEESCGCEEDEQELEERDSCAICGEEEENTVHQEFVEKED